MLLNTLIFTYGVNFYFYYQLSAMTAVKVETKKRINSTDLKPN